MTEAQLSQKIIKGILMRGRIAIKMSDRFHAGIPDIYFGRGHWLEVKIINCVHHFTPQRLLRKDQIRWMDKFDDYGNSCHLIVGAKFSKKMMYWNGDQQYKGIVTSEDCEEDLEVCLSSILR